MYAKTCAIAFIAVWLVNASLAAPAPEPEPEAQPDPCGCGNGCGIVTKVQAVPVRSNIPIKTTHKILSDNGCGSGWINGGWNNGGLSYGSCGDAGRWVGAWNGGSDWDAGCGGWGDCVITRIHHVPVISHIPIKTTHRVIPRSHSDCGYNTGLGTAAGYGNGCGCGCG